MPQLLFMIAFAFAAAFGRADEPVECAALPEPRVDEQTGVRWYRDIAYTEGEEAHPTKHRLDLLLPAEDKWREGRPMLIWIHGGGWTIGDKDDALGLYTRYCRILAENGVGTANISYRLSPDVKHPAHIEDVAAATAWLVERAGKIGFDKRHLFVSGHSAGGHLAALLATDHRWLEKQGLPRDTIAGAIPSSGVFDLESLVSQGRRWQRAFSVEDAPAASPVTHVDAEDPPFVLVIEGNGLFMQAQTRRLAEALKATGAEPEVVTLAGVNHITMLADLLDRNGAHATASLKLIDRVVRGPEAGNGPQEKPRMDTGQASGKSDDSGP